MRVLSKDRGILFLSCKKALQGQVFDAAEGCAEDYTYKLIDSRGLNCTDGAEKSEEAYCTQKSLFYLDRNGASEKCDYRANGSYYFITDVSCGY